MTIKKRINAKIKLFEVMNKLNKVNIKESFNIDEDIYATITTAIESLKMGELLSQRGGRNTSQSQKTEDGFFVEIDGFDREGNEYSFKFNIQSEENLDDDVIQVTNVDLVEFFFSSTDESEEIKLTEDDLFKFNQPKNVEYYDTIKNYIDIDLESDITKEQ
jgi:hypothetical protein